MTTNQSFVDLCITGHALADEIDDYVDRWHSNSDGRQLELSEFLGMNKHEYALWMRDPNAIYAIVKAHKFGASVDSYVDDYFYLPLAARSESTEDTKSVMEWLKNIGKIE